MIVFIFLIAVLSALCAGTVYLLWKKVVSIYRGGLFIFVSCIYFTAIFWIAHIMREALQ